MSIATAPTGPVPEERPICQEHSERVAVGTCSRCGRFVCESCVGEHNVCPACVKRQFLSLPPSAPRAQWTTRLLYGHAAFDALTVLVNLWALSSGGAPSALRDVAEGLIGLGVFGLAVGTAIVFLRWLHLTVRHAQAQGIDVGATPGWAVGYWFIPFANLVKPYHVIRKLLQELGGMSLVSAARVGTWWGVWIVGNMVSQLEGRLLMRGGLDSPTSSAAYSVGILASLLSVVGAILCVGVVRAIQQEMDAKRPDNLG